MCRAQTPSITTVTVTILHLSVLSTEILCKIFYRKNYVAKHNLRIIVNYPNTIIKNEETEAQFHMNHTASL